MEEFWSKKVQWKSKKAMLMLCAFLPPPQWKQAERGMDTVSHEELVQYFTPKKHFILFKKE